jgi:transposase
MFVDYAGATIPIHDPATGEIHPAAVFVAVLGAGSYTFAEATAGQDLRNWSGSHIRAFEYFGGVTEIVVPDNLKSAVTHPSYYEPDLNPTYRDLGEHYGAAIIPARPYRPKDKTYVSYCTSFRLCTGESWLPGPSASVSFNNDALVRWFV